MQWLKLMFKTKKNAIDILQQIAKRAEDLTPKEQADSFVSIRRIEGALQNRDSRIIFGRRGTGKTHIMSYMATKAIETQGISCSIDLRTLGSNNSIYSDPNIPASSRATTLIRDLLTQIHLQLLEFYTCPKSKFKSKQFEVALDELQNCVRTVVVTERQETRSKAVYAESAQIAGSTALNLSPIALSTKLNASGEAQTNNAEEWETKITGTPRLSVNMGDAFNKLDTLSKLLPGRLWILLDEWSSLPEQIQPYLADFIRRAILPIQNVTVYIAAIEYRSSFRIDAVDERIGLELGSDISADINLDDYFIYDFSSDASIQFFSKLLYKHLVALASDNGLVEENEQIVITNVFSQSRVFDELVRASEGVARDFINILQLAAMRTDNNKITMKEVNAAAKDWFERDKQRNLDTRENAQELLQWIRDEVIRGKKARAFLLNVSISHPLIEFLFDERILHIAKRSYSAQDDPGVRYRVWKIDYGCYVDLINTVNNPSNFLEDGIGIIGEDFSVPDDDYRAVRRAILKIDEFDKKHS